MKTGPIIRESVGSVYGAQMRILLFLPLRTVEAITPAEAPGRALGNESESGSDKTKY